MKYIFTSNGCPRCVIRKRELTERQIEFEERDASRLEGGTPYAELDAIDREAHVQLNMNNMQLPVEVDVWVARKR